MRVRIALIGIEVLKTAKGISVELVRKQNKCAATYTHFLDKLESLIQAAATKFFEEVLSEKS